MRIGVDTYAFGMLICAVCAVGAGTYQTKYSFDARAAALQPEVDRLWESYEGGMSDEEFETRTNGLVKANPSLAEHIQSYLSIRAVVWQDESNVTFQAAVEKGDIKLLAKAEVSGVVAELWHVERRSDRVAVRMLLRGSDSVDIVSGSSRSGDESHLEHGGKKYSASAFGGGNRWRVGWKTMKIPTEYSRAVVREFEIPKELEGEASLMISERLTIQGASGREERAFSFPFSKVALPPAPKQVFFGN